MAAIRLIDQYKSLKEQYPDPLLFFRLGDFYELFYDDALKAHTIMGIQLTARSFHKDEKAPMCGVPASQLDVHLSKLTSRGFSVAVVEQIPWDNDGIMHRDVVRVVTPGTDFSELGLDARESRLLCTVYEHKGLFGLAVCDVSTGEMRATQHETFAALYDELAALSPRELLVRADVPFEQFLPVCACTQVVTPTAQNPTEVITQYFCLHESSLFGLEHLPASVPAVAVLLEYLQKTQRHTLSHVVGVKPYRSSEFVRVDENALRSFDILPSLWRKNGALVDLLDVCQTAGGSRLLRQWLVKPLKSREAIEQRQQYVTVFADNQLFRTEVRRVLSQLPDMARLLGKFGNNRANGRDMLAFAKWLFLIQEVRFLLKPHTLFETFDSETAMLDMSLAEELVSVLHPEPPVTIQERGIFVALASQDLSALQQQQSQLEQAMRTLLEHEKESSGIKTLRLALVKDAWCFEVSRAQTDLSLIPTHWQFVQTLTTSIRYSCPQLADLQDALSQCLYQQSIFETTLFYEYQKRLLSQVSLYHKVFAMLEMIDVFASFATVMAENRYVFARTVDDRSCRISHMRHPIAEKGETHYVPNDVLITPHERVHIITGPNMWGKSTYLRAVGLTVLLHQIGCGVPAQSAELCLFDEIFTRVWAHDNLLQKQSTFLIEMQEMAHILHQSTDRSLVLLDEVGRGTATYDGLALARAMVEFLFDRTQAHILFATHYHELADMTETRSGFANYSAAVHEQDGDILFLYRIVRGKAHKSFGITAAKRAGIPAPVLAQATRYLAQLEQQTVSSSQTSLFPVGEPIPVPSVDLALVECLSDIQSCDIGRMTPLDALVFLDTLQKKYKTA